MPLLMYKCPKCNSTRELFDDESKQCKTQLCETTMELVIEGNVTAAATTNTFENRHIVYDSFHTRTEWNNQDMKRLEAEKAAKAFQQGLKKL